MVHITRLPTFVFLSVLATCFLASLVESAEMECETLIQSVDPDEKPVKYTVFLESESNDDHKDWLCRCYGYKMKTTISSDDDDKTAYDLINMKAYVASFPKALVNVLSEHKEVKLMEKDGKMNINYAIPNNLFKRAERVDPEQNLDRIDQTKGTNGKFIFPDSAGEGVNIFVVDSGVNIKHSEFDGGRAKIGKTICGTCDNDDDENGHGTQVASIAAGKTFGVASKANVIAVRVLDAKGAGANTDVIAGLEFVLSQHNKAKNKNTVVNMSLGGGFSAAVNGAVAKLTTAGVHVAVAAGNDAKDACKSSPSSELTAVTVGATDSKTDKIAFFSSNGKCLDIFAPGVNINGADAANIDGSVAFSGTSQATPHVAGTIALLISKDGNQTPAAMSKTLIDLSTKDIVKPEDGKDNGGNANDLKGAPNNFLRVPAP